MYSKSTAKRCWLSHCLIILASNFVLVNSFASLDHSLCIYLMQASQYNFLPNLLCCFVIYALPVAIWKIFAVQSSDVVAIILWSGANFTSTTSAECPQYTCSSFPYSTLQRRAVLSNELVRILSLIINWPACVFKPLN